MARRRGAAALVAAGLDVLYTDATAVFVRARVPAQAEGEPAEVQVMLQRDDWPQDGCEAPGRASTPASGFALARGAPRRGPPWCRTPSTAGREFYLRWNNALAKYAGRTC